MTKLVIDAKTRRVLGVHVIGERATELVPSVKPRYLSATVDLFIDMVFNFPTLAGVLQMRGVCVLGRVAEQSAG
jgi:NAD(P) transhydrogenase